ncbi:MAG: ATP-grasp domain-containing protein [Planctomycetaceae bacterium]
MVAVTWVLESGVFPETHSQLREAVLRLGHSLIDWNDSWWSDGIPPTLPTQSVVFHGSLGNAALVSERLRWSPGSFCPVDPFRCTSWYESAREFLVHNKWHFTTARELVEKAAAIGIELGSPDALFVRPDSPLKPFSGRVVKTASLTLKGLDYGFYYDDEDLPVVAAPIRQIGREWRFVVVRGDVITGSAYDATTRKPITADLDSHAATFASHIASTIPPPAEVYVLDVCESDVGLRLLELNPFGGADLYACHADTIVQSISHLIPM